MSKKLFAVLIVPAGLFVIAMYNANGPRPRSVDSVPIAFWAWRLSTPEQEEVERAASVTGSRSLFIHAGQFDLANGAVERVRPVKGQFPTGIETHLVYNAKRVVLDSWEHVDLNAAAATTAQTFAEDTKRAHGDGAEIDGIQLDLDIPERMLGRYREFLHLLRGKLPPNTKLSITGLASWANSSDLPAVLAETDFWLPQFYGYGLAIQAGDRMAIGSEKEVTAVIDRIRSLNKPFYAGLAAFAFTTLYNRSGAIAELRGDIGVEDILESGLFELGNRDLIEGENRSEFIVKKEGVVDGLTVQPGELLVFQTPTSASLAVAAGAARERGGDTLLGICLFRLPTANDTSALSLEEIQAAVLDVPTHPTTDITSEQDRTNLTFVVRERGSARSAAGDAGITVDIRVPAGSVSDSFDASYSTWCGDFASAVRCTSRRGDLIRLNLQSARPGEEFRVSLPIKTGLPPQLQVRVITHVDDGRIEVEFLNLQVRQDRGIK
ncbi:MAG TPA: DUF3142 domain-containing protein [Pyrinomonadaceae bacterium]|jgi:hypothetical protein